MFVEQIRRLKASGDPSGLDRICPYAAVVGLSCRRESTGLVTVLTARDSNIGNTTLRAVHGGVLGALLEHAAIMQLLWELEPEHMPKIVNLSVDYLRPASGERETYAHAVVVKHGRRVANVRVEAWQEERARAVVAGHAHFVLG